MKKGVKTVILTIVLILLLLVWAPWMDNQAIHDKILKEKGWKDGTIMSMERAEELNRTGNFRLTEEIIEESEKLGITDGVVLCDYNVMWWPFGRLVVSCEGGYIVTFWGKIR